MRNPSTGSALRLRGLKQRVVQFEAQNQQRCLEYRRMFNTALLEKAGKSTRTLHFPGVDLSAGKKAQVVSFSPSGPPPSLEAAARTPPGKLTLGSFSLGEAIAGLEDVDDELEEPERLALVQQALQDGAHVEGCLYDELGESVSHGGDTAYSAAYLAARDGYPEILKLLLEQGASIRDASTEGETLWHAAAKGGGLRNGGALACLEVLKDQYSSAISRKQDMNVVFTTYYNTQATAYDLALAERSRLRRGGRRLRRLIDAVNEVLTFLEDNGAVKAVTVARRARDGNVRDIAFWEPVPRKKPKSATKLGKTTKGGRRAKRAAAKPQTLTGGLFGWLKLPKLSDAFARRRRRAKVASKLPKLSPPSDREKVSLEVLRRARKRGKKGTYDVRNAVAKELKKLQRSDLRRSTKNAWAAPGLYDSGAGLKWITPLMPWQTN